MVPVTDILHIVYEFDCQGSSLGLGGVNFAVSISFAILISCGRR